MSIAIYQGMEWFPRDIYLKYFNIFKVTTVCLFVRLMTPMPFYIVLSFSFIWENPLRAETWSALYAWSRQSRHSCKFLQVGPFNIYLMLHINFFLNISSQRRKFSKYNHHSCVTLQCWWNFQMFRITYLIYTWKFTMVNIEISFSRVTVYVLTKMQTFGG